MTSAYLVDDEDAGAEHREEANRTDGGLFTPLNASRGGGGVQAARFACSRIDFGGIVNVGHNEIL